MGLAVLSYLAPSVPAELFTALAHHLGDALDREVDLRFDPSRSGPRPGEHEPFTSGEVDVAFVCATSYVWLTGDPAPPIRLVGAGWVPTDPRSGGRPVYHGDVLAPTDGPRSLQGLAGTRVAYNDDVSLSGYHSLRLALHHAGVDADAVRLVRSGSHLGSLELLRAGRVDAAAVDSTVWRRRRAETPSLAHELVPVATLGPHPVQPVVARAGLPARVRERVRAALLAAHASPVVAAALAAAQLHGFASTSERDFTDLRTELARIGPRPGWR